MDDLKVIPPLGYFKGTDGPGIVYLVDNAENFTIQGYEVLYGDLGNRYIGFVKKGRDKVYFLCPIWFIERIISELQDEVSHINFYLVFFSLCEGLGPEKIGHLINYKISVVELTKLLLLSQKDTTLQYSE